MRDLIEKFSIPFFYGYTLFLQPLAAFLAARWLTLQLARRGRRLLGWLAGFAVTILVFLVGWVAISFRLQLSHLWYGNCPTCFEYTGLSYIIHAASGILSLLIFLATGFTVTRKKSS